MTRSYGTYIIIVPMAGAPSTPELVIAGLRSGAFALLAAGNNTEKTVAEEIRGGRQSPPIANANDLIIDT